MAFLLWVHNLGFAGGGVSPFHPSPIILTGIRDVTTLSGTSSVTTMTAIKDLTDLEGES